MTGPAQHGNVDSPHATRHRSAKRIAAAVLQTAIRLARRGPAGRALVSLATVTGIFCLYWVLVVPWIEPRLKLESKSAAASLDTSESQSLAANAREELALWFPEDAWQRGETITIESDRAWLLVKNYKNRRDGTVEIKPCTIIFFPEPPLEGNEDWVRKAVILDAPEGAVMRFDRPIDLRRFQFGKVVGGQLTGPIAIRSDMEQPGPDDDLFVTAQNAELSTSAITSKQPVNFRLGTHHGSGLGLHIELLSSGSKSDVQGLRWLRLERDVRMHIDLADIERRRATDAANPAPQQPASAAGETVHVRSVGPFRFDFEKRMATFRRNVEVQRRTAHPEHDTLLGNLVAIHFTPPEGASQSDDQSQVLKLEPSRLEARGAPVVLRAPSSSVEATGTLMEYDLRTGQGSLQGEQGVLLRRGENEIHAPELHFQPGADGGWGTFSATGPGTIRGIAPDEEGTKLSARWGKTLSYAPHEGAPLVSLLQDAELAVPGQGRLSGQSIYVWLRPVEATNPTNASTPATQLEPDRLLAQGDVRFELGQLRGAVKDLQAWFEQSELPDLTAKQQAKPSTPGPTRETNASAPVVSGYGQTAVTPVPGVATPTRAPRTPAPVPMGPTKRNQPLPAKPRFQVDAGSLQVELRTTVQGTELSALKLSRAVTIVELWTEQPGEQPLRMSGDEVEMMGSGANGQSVVLQGSPARVRARGMAIEGGKIELDRAANRLRVVGPGRMKLPMDRDLDGAPLAEPQPLDIVWQRGMRFDGRSAYFDAEVVAQIASRRLHSSTMQVDFQEPIDLNRPMDDQQPDVRQVVCRGGVMIDSRTHAEAGLVSIERMRTKDLSIQRPSGDITATGPGTLTLVRQGGRAALTTPLTSDPTAAAPEDDQGLTYLGIEFRRGLIGNMVQRRMTFADEIEAVVGPVQHWDETISPDVFDAPDPPGMLMRCDQLSVVQVEGADGRFAELEAIGNTTVESGVFYARANVIRYAEVKDLIVLEGSERAKAELWRQLQPGAPRSGTTARKILYWRNTGHVEIDDADQLDLNLLSTPGRRTAVQR